MSPSRWCLRSSALCPSRAIHAPRLPSLSHPPKFSCSRLHIFQSVRVLRVMAVIASSCCSGVKGEPGSGCPCVSKRCSITCGLAEDSLGDIDPLAFPKAAGNFAPDGLGDPPAAMAAQRFVRSALWKFSALDIDGDAPYEAGHVVEPSFMDAFPRFGACCLLAEWADAVVAGRRSSSHRAQNKCVDPFDKRARRISVPKNEAAYCHI